MAAIDDSVLLENRPAILMVGSSNVGKRTLLTRLLSVSSNDNESKSNLFTHAWTIDTKYYTAEVAMWLANLSEGEDLIVTNLPCYSNLAALVLVFDLNNMKSFDALRNWVSKVDLSKFDVLLCIGNKVDLIEGHAAHFEYNKHMIRKSEGCDYASFESEGIGLLAEEESFVGVKKSLYAEWCVENGIEYVEACAANAEFDKCLSVDGDSQGVERLYGALSAHMWPGMVLKLGNGGRVVEPYLPRGDEEVSDVESDFEFGYEVLSDGSADPWNDADEGWVSASGQVNGKSVSDSNNGCRDVEVGCSSENIGPSFVSTKNVNAQEHRNGEALEDHTVVEEELPDLGSHFEFEDLERLISEIGGMRDSLRLMPDFQRREMAAKLALRMADMFGGESEDED